MLALGCKAPSRAENTTRGSDSLGTGSLDLGAPCVDDSECTNALCVDVGGGGSICTSYCNASRDCPAGDNWDCTTSPGRIVNVCVCKRDNTSEICGDGIDNDCDGIVDCGSDKKTTAHDSGPAETPPDAGAPPRMELDAGSSAPTTASCADGGCDSGMPAIDCTSSADGCPRCTADADCDDHIACTVDRCQARGCVHDKTDALCTSTQVCDPRKGGCEAARACSSSDDCKDDDACTVAENCDPASKICRFSLLDGDGDGHLPSVCGGDDCDDSDPLTYPGALDVCDGRDNDCNGSVDPPSPALGCADDRMCSAGVCACKVGVLCEDHCVDPSSFAADDAHCGSCDNACSSGFVCSQASCIDVDECSENPTRCGAHGSCHNQTGSYSCSCDSGYAWATDHCADLDECVLATDTCDKTTTACVNTAGSYGCVWRAVAIASGVDSACAILEDHTLKCWGGNSSGELGLGDTYYRGYSPDQIGNALPNLALGTGRTALEVAVGAESACAILDDASLKCWGLNDRGQLGQGDTNARGDQANEMGDSLPAIALGTNRSAKAVAVGEKHACALLDDGSVKCWGKNDSGQLGLGDTNARGDQANEMGDKLPTVALGTGRSAKAIVSGSNHSCALLDNGSVKCWGQNSLGQLGVGDTNARGDQANEMGDKLPAVALGTGRVAKAITSSGYHVCALLDDASVKCWGYNAYGQLGLGTTTNHGDMPNQLGDQLGSVALGTGRSAKAIAAGAFSSCALLDDGSLKCWGRNASGELGLGDTQNRGDDSGELGDHLPTVALGTMRSAVQLALGDLSACALLDDATVKCWGANDQGQLGQGDQQNRGDAAGEMGDALHAIDLGGP